MCDGCQTQIHYTPLLQETGRSTRLVLMGGKQRRRTRHDNIRGGVPLASFLESSQVTHQSRRTDGTVHSHPDEFRVTKSLPWAEL